MANAVRQGGPDARGSRRRRLVGQATGLSKPSLAAVATIASVEARHAAWIRDLIGEPPAPAASNPSETAAQVAAAIGRTGFVQGGA